ncbi:MAG: hypothetical protein IJZ89_02685 [Clostridia bacterium]|nr:hypothetical protein [Clostridia bacterium]
MNTIKFDKKNVKMVAHRGVSGLECENTNAAFVAAGNRSYFGVETDMHITADGKFAIIHDQSTKRVSGIDADVENLPFDAVRGIRLYDRKAGVTRSDLCIPSLEEYIRICHRYDKVCVLELKDCRGIEKYREMIEIIKANDHLDKTIFISFGKDNCLMIKEIMPEAKVQFLISEWNDDLLPWLKENGLDLDIYYGSVTKELVDLIHENGMEINCWTVDKAEDGERLAAWGVDYITSNILE